MPDPDAREMSTPRAIGAVYEARKPKKKRKRKKIHQVKGCSMVAKDNPLDAFFKGTPPTDSDHERRRKHKRLLGRNERELLTEQSQDKEQ